MSEVAAWSGPSTFTSGDEVWHVERALGAGGAGRTCLVRRGSASPDDPTRYVLKELHLEALEDWKQVELFERELQVLRALDHPGIPRVIDVVHDVDGRPQAIVQTCVEGRSLRQHLDDGGPLDGARFERTLRQVLEILVFLHGHVPPIVHRDITPANVMLDDTRAWLIDFGAVRWAQRESTEMTSVGTFGYMPPEQILGRAVPASDLYSLGVTLVEVATGRSPGELPTDASSGALDTAAALATVPALAPQVRDVLVAMTRPGVGDRLGDPGEALRRLDAPPPAPRIERAPANAAATPSSASQQASRTRAMLALVALLALCGVVFFVVASPGAPPDMHEPAAPPQVAVAAEPSPATRSQQPPPSAPTPPQQPPKASPPTRQPPPTPPPVEAWPAELTDDNSAQVTVTSQPPGASVSMGDEVLGATPLVVRLPFGKHELTLTHGDQTVTRGINVLRDTRFGHQF